MGPLPMRFGPGGPLLTGVHFSWYTCNRHQVPVFHENRSPVENGPHPLSACVLGGGTISHRP